MKELLEEINEAVEWYQSRKKNAIDIDKLIHMRRGLSTRLYDLADKLGGLKESHNMDYFKRKSTEAKLKREFQDKGDNGTVAGSKAEVEVIPIFEEERRSEALYYRCKYLYEAGKDVLDSMSQDISYLKFEKRETEQGH